MTDKFIINTKRIDRIEELNISQLTCADIRPHYGTGQAIPKTSERSKAPTYRHGIGTNVGDIELSVWEALAEQMIDRLNERQLYNSLLEWLTECPIGKPTKAELKHEALDYHMRRMFDDPLWVDYIPFNNRYRPEVLLTADIVTVICPCCKKPDRVTREQTNNAFNKRISCPVCGRWRTFQILKFK